MIGLLVRLCRPVPAALVALTTLVGYSCAGGRLLSGALFATVGVFLLAVAATVGNQLQERETDSRMRRTASRPLPRGEIGPGTAAALALLPGIVGSGLLGFAGGLRTVGLGLLCVVFYNILYTPLKRQTSLAVFVGAPCGALPPVIGWSAGGGTLADPTIWLLALLLLLWQIPHTLLFVLHHREDFRRAGLPVFAADLPVARVRALLQLWLLAVAAAGLLLPLTGQLRFLLSAGVFVLLAAALATSSSILVRRSDWRSGFAMLNLYLLIAMGTLLADRMVLIHSF